MLVTAVVIVSILNVGAVDEPTAPTEYITVATEVVTEVSTDISTESYSEMITEVSNDYEVLCFILFGVSMFVGIEFARAFSFWKW